ncbi:MAG: site-specific integrase [ANME-2 cluster archaeon]|nr:MAG: site-specific integrase [ANME-2 cluster archaeon]
MAIKVSKVEKFLNIYDGQTRITYKASVNRFVGFICDIEIKQGRQTDDVKAMFLSKANEYIEDSTRNHYDDLMAFAQDMKERKVPNKTARTYMIGLKEWFLHCDIELKTLQWKDINHKMPNGSKATTKETIIDKEIISQILEHMPLKGKAFVLFAASSGMRIGELLQITLNDIDLNKSPIPVTIDGDYTKGGESRITFINEEAKEILLKWLKYREQYLEVATQKHFGADKDINDNRIFPFSRLVVYQMWHKALKNTKLFTKDKKTDRTQLRVHGLRKYFRSQLAIGCPVDIVEALMGHEGYLTSEYRNLPEEQLSEHYAKHEHLLYISMAQPDFELKEATTKQQEQIKNLEAQLENISTSNKSQIEEYVEDVAIENNKLKTEMAEMRELINKLVYDQAKANMKAK